MTPRQSALAALRREQPKGLVPHMELEFQLTDELFGEAHHALKAEDLQGVSGTRRQDMLKRNAELWVKVAERFKWSIITGLHWLEMADQCQSFEYVREVAGDTYMLSAFADGTLGIPSGETMVAQVLWLTENTEEALETLDEKAQQAIQQAQELMAAGAEVVLMCADYCFNDGPFLSPGMFAKFVTPFLKRQVQAIHAAGGLAVKHTDGDIMPILDQLVATGIDGLHSLDPMAGVDIAEVKQRYGDCLCLLGNVNCAVVQSGTAEQIEQSARYCLQYGGAEQGGYVFATSNCIFTGVPLHNYEVMLRMRQQFGYVG